MLLAKHGIIPSEYWRHDKLLRNKDGQTVAIILSSKGIVPDEYWMHDIDMKDNNGNSIKSNLLRNNYIYQNGEFKYNV